MTLTTLERKTAFAIAAFCYHEPYADVLDLMKELELTAPQVKGVLGSLVKKGVAMVATEEANGLDNDSTQNQSIYLKEMPQGFYCDEYEKDEYNEIIKKLLK